MRVEVVTPEDYMGDVIGDLNSRRGQISTQEQRGNATVITAMVPLANMFGYINALRSMSQGRAQYSMFFDHYDKVPQNVQDEVTKKTGSIKMEKQNIRIKLRTYDNKILDQSTEEIVNTVKRTGANIKGPIPLPTKIERYTVLRSPHIDKKVVGQFEIEPQRLIDIIEPTPQTVEALMKLDLASGVDVEIKI